MTDQYSILFLGIAAFSDITTAISVLLPTYIIMDVILAWVYRKSVPYALLWPMAAAGIVGVFLAALAFRYVDTTYLAIFFGAMSFVIGVKFFVARAGQNDKDNTPFGPPDRIKLCHWLHQFFLDG